MRRIASIILLLAAVIGTAAGADERLREGQAAVFASRAELVVLDVVVTTRSGGYVADLPRDVFAVYEEGRLQPIELFSAEDAPATIGLLIDSSASMYGMRDLIVASVRAFASTSNPDDELFGLTFNEFVRPVLPAERPFTSDPELLATELRTALRTHGRTALHDAIAAGLAYLERGRHARKVLLVISDGGDNASTSTFEQVAHAAAASNTVIYTIATLDRGRTDARPDRLRGLARLTGGTSQQPSDDREVHLALEQVAHDIRSSYSVGYAPPQAGPSVRHVKVAVRAPRGGRLNARTRTEYVRPSE